VVRDWIHLLETVGSSGRERAPAQDCACAPEGADIRFLAGYLHGEPGSGPAQRHCGVPARQRRAQRADA
jgi:hypothetical protein